jgi:PAS domain S-box-containing protein
MKERQRMYVLILIMIMASVIVTGITIHLLYEAAFVSQKERLVVTAKSHARLIEAVARFDARHLKKWHPHTKTATDATMSQVIEAHKHYPGFGKTGEFTLARRNEDHIEFLLRHRHSNIEKPKPIRFDSNLAEPMRRALNGDSGTIVGLDYRGETVLAAYEPVAELELGIVVKIDLSEIRKPFVRAGLLAGIIGFVVIVFSSLTFIRISNPIVRTMELRTSELEKVNEEMRQEIEERKRAEEEVIRLALVVEHSDDAIILKTLDGIIVDWNKSAEKIYGYTANEVIGQSISILVPSDRPEEEPKILEKIKEGVPVDHYETVRQRKDGNLVDISLTISPIKNKSGEIIGASTIGRDITKRKRSEKEMQESEERFRNLVENSLTGISIVQENEIVYQNPEQERLLGPLPRKPKLGDIENIHPDDVDKVRAFYQNATSNREQVLDIDFRFYPKDADGKKLPMKWVQCRTSSVEHDGREAVMVNIMDITRIKEMEHLLRIQDKMTSLGRVSAGIAHEIRNPLSGINIYLNTLEKIYARGDSVEKVKEILEQLQSASNRIESVIKRVMDFSKPALPKLVSTDLNQAIENALKLSSVSLRKKGIKVQKNLNVSLPMGKADPYMIEQVILNLITNAADAMKDSVGDKLIEAQSLVRRNSIVLKISDSGSGIPLELVDKVFDPFYTTKNGSTGIGLSLAHRIITDHGGTLVVSTSRWGGAEFTIEIPLERNDG